MRHDGFHHGHHHGHHRGHGPGHPDRPRHLARGPLHDDERGPSRHEGPRHADSRHGGPGHGGHRHDGPGHRHERGGRRGRLFDHGELRLVVLALIAEQPRHGYEIIKEIEERVAGTYSPSPGVIYPTLTLLEELGLASLAEAGGKKLYAITPDGTRELQANQAATDAALARMRAVNAANSGGPAPELIRAAENLKLALRLRQGRGPLNEDQVRAIAAILDAAAVAVERS